MTGDEANHKPNKSKNNEPKRPPSPLMLKKKKGSDKIENNLEVCEPKTKPNTPRSKNVAIKKPTTTITKTSELEKKKQIDSALADWLGTGTPTQEPILIESKEKRKTRGLLKRKVRTPRDDKDDIENTINQTNEYLNNEEFTQNELDKRELLGMIKISIFSNLFRENNQEKLGIKIFYQNQEINNEIILPVTDNPIAYPSQWSFPIKSKIHKESKIELSVVDMSTSLQFSSPTIEIPIIDIPYLHESMIFGCQKHYLWKLKHQEIPARLTVGVKVTKLKYISTINDEWNENNAGGCLDCASWSISPQFYFQLPFCEFVIIHLISQLGFTNSIGFYILKLNTNYDSPDYFSPIIFGKHNPNSFNFFRVHFH